MVIYNDWLIVVSSGSEMLQEYVQAWLQGNKLLPGDWTLYII